MLAALSRMRARTIVMFAAIANALSTPAAGTPVRETRHLRPSSNWVVNYADESCSLGRTFGEGPDQVALIMEQLVPGDSFKMMFAGASLDLKGRTVNATLRFGPNESEGVATALSATTNNTPAILLQQDQRLAPLTGEEIKARKQAFDRHVPYDPIPIATAREKSATWLRLGNTLPFDLVLETGPMDEPLEALRRCSWDTVRTWGLDVEQQKHLTRKVVPKSSPHTWLSPDDYPSEMRNGGYEAIVNVRVIVDGQGKPVSCHIQTSTRPKEFDDVVCRRIMGHARFIPALDATGHPVTSYWQQSVTFALN
jgi:hypothetical protein